ncbi:MAG: TetR/AcrR family transcriptional regulator [Stenotrophobium sp.]
MAKVNTRRKRETPSTHRGEARRKALLLAAREVFLEKGYVAASVEDVVSRVGGSKATLYSYFGSKEGLFGDLIAELCDEYVSTLAIPREIDGDIEKTLNQFGRRMLKLFLDPQQVALYRSIFAELSHFPELAGRLYASSALRSRRELGDFLGRQHAAGVLDCPDPLVTASSFLELIKGAPQRRALLGLQAFASEREMKTHVANAVQLFLHGCLHTRVRT